MKGWDYSSAGWYFVTICTHARNPFFGVVHEGNMFRSDLGEIARRYWLDIPDHFPHALLDEFVIMPDHVHGIIVINPTKTYPVETQHVFVETQHVFVEMQHAASLQVPHISLPKAGSISAIVRSYKSAVTHWAHENGKAEFSWQTRIYDRIIRDEASLANLRLYILENPHNITKNDFDPLSIEK